MLNGIMFQGFEWELPADGQHYRRLIELAPRLAAQGVTAVWLPPVYKGSSVYDQGYSVYDLYDLGEFDQKGTVGTKYGTKSELLEAVQVLKGNGMHVYLDVVLNQRVGGDHTEAVTVEKMNPDNRQETISDPYEIDAWTHFTFAGRHRQYSDLELHWYHFTGVDYDERNKETAIYRIIGENKYWADDVSGEHGNFDYLLGCDVDHAHPEIRDDLMRWADWIVETTGADGFRLDAVKHMSAAFIHDLVEHVRAVNGQDFYFVAEYWENDVRELDQYLEATGQQLTLFDVTLHFNLFTAALQGGEYDLRRIFDNTTVMSDPTRAVTFVDNHDSQPGQSLESVVGEWFKPHAYALILLREAGYPCVFYGDYLGTGSGSIPSFQGLLDKLMAMRRIYAHGKQTDYFESPNCIGWVRENEANEAALAVILSNGPAASLRMYVGHDSAGETFADYLGNREDKVTIDGEGFGEFPVGERSLSCWLRDNMTLNLDEALRAINEG